MRHRIIAGIAIAAGALWMIAQNQSTPNSLGSVFPGGALVYVETRDLSALLRDWNASSEKKLWLASSNHEVFSRTRLFLRLAEAQQQFVESAGFPADMSLVNSVAGAQSAIAIYDIGELEFLYITRMPSARVLASLPFTQSKAYESRESAGVTYYLRSGPSKRVAAFGTVDDLLFLGTRGDLVANAIALHAQRPAMGSLAQERWFDAASRAAATPGEARIVLNMAGLLKTPHFRSYWVQRNASDLRPFHAGIVDLFREAGQVREERSLLRETQATAPNEQAVAQVAAWVPADAGLYKAWANPSTDLVLNLLRDKLIQPGEVTDAYSSSAPVFDAAGVAGDASDLETRIDQVPLAVDKTDRMAPWRSIVEAAGVQALLQVQGSRPSGDGVFIRNDTAIALLASTDWPEVTIPGVAIHRSGRTLVLASDDAMLQRVVSRLGNTPQANGAAAYSARYRHARELAPFTRMMRQMDAASSETAGDEPRFFSQNVASLGQVLQRVESASIVAHDDGTRLTQQMIYRLTQ